MKLRRMLSHTAIAAALFLIAFTAMTCVQAALAAPQEQRRFACRYVLVERFDTTLVEGHQHAVLAVGPSAEFNPDGSIKLESVFPEGVLCAYLAPADSVPSRS